MKKCSLQMYTLREYTDTLEKLAHTIERLRKIGFQTVQYSVPEHFDRQAVKEIFDANGMENDSVFCPSLFIEEKTSQLLADCALFGTDYIRLDSIPAGLAGAAAGYRMYAHYLNEATRELKRQGKKVLYHFHAFEFIRFGAHTGIEIFLRESDPEVVQIIPDTHWIHSGGVNVCEFLEKYKDRYDYVHVKDFAISGRKEILEARPISFAPVGEGNLAWGPILELCEKNHVASYAIEQDDCYGRDPFDCVESSLKFLQKSGVDGQ